MSMPDVRNDKAYRRGLILGLTIAEIMILLIFVILMALGSTLANREQQVQALDHGGAQRLVEAVQRAYPNARSQDDYFKELTEALAVRQQVEQRGEEAAGAQLVEDARLGRELRQAAAASETSNPADYLRELVGAREEDMRNGWPPFFSLSEAGGYYFDSGRATLRPEFEQNLRNEVIPLLRRNIDQYRVDVVEVIGHTDEVPMGGSSNLDTQLIRASAGQVPIGSLTSTDNAGLAIARSVAVVRILRSDPRLRGVTILPLSGAQMIVPVDRVADGTARSSDQARRRIEIRLRRSTNQANAGGVQVVGSGNGNRR